MYQLCSGSCESWHEVSDAPVGHNDIETLEYLIIYTSKIDAEGGQAD